MNIKKKLLTLIPYVVVMAITFYLLPLLMQDTGSAMFFMLLVIPLVTLICSVVYGVRQGFDLLFPIVIMILFAPTIIVFYNLSAWIYIVVYGVVVLIGSAIGTIFYKKSDKSRC
uniref:hypothetical protein n=1 Tax=Agathobacter sp. TaxID=2021311 RepID=UPI004057803E